MKARINTAIFLALLVGSTISAMAQKGKNPFFVLHNGIRGDSTHKTYDQQVALIKSIGFDGVEINQIESFVGMKAALDRYDFTGSYFYVRLNLDGPLDARLVDCLAALRGTKTVVAPYLVSDQKTYPSSSRSGDSVAVRLVRKLADLARRNGLDVALYPHVNFWLERTDHARDLVRQVNRSNVGMAFNLCHYLATTTLAERDELPAHLRTLRPYLKLVTICGADNVPLTDELKPKEQFWAYYLQPLGAGNFDTYGLVERLTKKLGYTGPIGLQCYNIKGDKPTNLRQAMVVWRQYQTRLAR